MITIIEKVIFLPLPQMSYETSYKIAKMSSMLSASYRKSRDFQIRGNNVVLQISQEPLELICVNRQRSNTTEM